MKRKYQILIYPLIEPGWLPDVAERSTTVPVRPKLFAMTHKLALFMVVP